MQHCCLMSGTHYQSLKSNNYVITVGLKRDLVIRKKGMAIP